MAYYYYQMFRVGLGMMLAMLLLDRGDEMLHGIMKPPDSPSTQFMVLFHCILMPEIIALIMIAAWLVKKTGQR